MDFDKKRGVNTFELTIRILAGLESAYETDPSPFLKSKVKEVGEKIMGVYNFKDILPYSDLVLDSGEGVNMQIDSILNTAEMYTPLEIYKLSEITNEPSFRK